MRLLPSAPQPQSQTMYFPAMSYSHCPNLFEMSSLQPTPLHQYYRIRNYCEMLHCQFWLFFRCGYGPLSYGGVFKGFKQFACWEWSQVYAFQPCTAFVDGFWYYFWEASQLCAGWVFLFLLWLLRTHPDYRPFFICPSSWFNYTLPMHITIIR